MRSFERFVFAGLLSLVFLSGCISQLPTPTVARSGDVVNIGLGGIKRNAGGQLLRPADMTVTVWDGNNQPHTPLVIGVYRIFPDHTSQYAVNVQNQGDINFGELEPHDGAYWMAIRLSEASGAGIGLNLAPGEGRIEVSDVDDKLTQTSFVEDGAYNNFPLTILPGTRDPSDWGSDNQFLAYQTEGYLTLKPSADPDPGVTIGGVQIELVYNDAVDDGDPFMLRLVPLNHDPNMGLIQKIKDNPGVTRTLKAILTNPNGFVPSASWEQGQSTLLDLHLAITSLDGNVADYPASFLPLVFNVAANGELSNDASDCLAPPPCNFYVDINGDVIPGIVPVLSNEFN